MKKKISVLAAVLLAFGLAACGNNEGQAVSDSTRNIQSGKSQKTETTNNSEKEADEVATSEDASSTNDEIVGDISSEVTESPEENGGTLP